MAPLIADARRRILEIICLNCRLDGATLVPENRKQSERQDLNLWAATRGSAASTSSPPKLCPCASVKSLSRVVAEIFSIQCDRRLERAAKSVLLVVKPGAITALRIRQESLHLQGPQEHS